MSRHNQPGVHIVTNIRTYKGKTYRTHLLRRSYREDGKVKKQTLANLSHLPDYAIKVLRSALAGKTMVPAEQAGGHTVRTIPHGHVVAVLGTLRNLGIEHMLGSRRNAARDRCVCLIADRILSSGVSKLATARSVMSGNNALSTLGDALGIKEVTAEEFYEAMDWLAVRQAKIEKSLAERHLGEGVMILYDVSSSSLEGSHCELGARGYCRDGKRGKLQIVYGLLCSEEGCPVAVEVFEGNTSDPKTLETQIRKVRERFGLRQVVLVGDRGMLTSKRINEELRPVEGLEWITSLQSVEIKKLVEEQGPLQRSLFDETDMANIFHPDFPGERLVACLNPLIAKRRRHTRERLLAATQRELDKIVAATRREKRRLHGADRIGVRVGRVLNRFKVGKYFKTTITEDSFEYARNEERIKAESALDGIYVIRTSVSEQLVGDADTVRAYKGLKNVEQAFRRLKTVGLNIGPVYHRLERRVRSHVFICMLAYYVEWHMCRAWAPFTFAEDDPAAPERLAESPVGPARKSQSTKRKASSKTTAQGLAVHSFEDLIRQLATLTRATKEVGGIFYDEVVPPTELQGKALELLEVKNLL